MHFLLRYTRKTGHLEYSEYAGGSRAYTAYCKAESEAPDGVEVVLLSAPSIDAIKKTHGNYFEPESALFPLIRSFDDENL